MNAQTQKSTVQGAAGAIEVAIDTPAGGAASKGVAVIAHPHPLFGGTLDNKVVQTLARAFTQGGWTAVRFNFRGVGATAGTHDEGRGELDDMLPGKLTNWSLLAPALYAARPPRLPLPSMLKPS